MSFVQFHVHALKYSVRHSVPLNWRSYRVLLLQLKVFLVTNIGIEIEIEIKIVNRYLDSFYGILNTIRFEFGKYKHTAENYSLGIIEWSHSEEN